MHQTGARRGRLLVALAFGLTFLFGLLRFEGATQGYWDTYITVPAVFMTDQTVNFVLKDGSPAWNSTLRGVLPDDLVDKDGFGIITKDQRIGAPVIAAPLFCGFGVLGFRLLFALSVALIIPCGILASRSVWLALGSEPNLYASLLASLLIAWNPYVLSIGRLNANLLVLPLALLLIHLLLQSKTPLVITGLLFGAVAAVRNEAICFVPAICLWMLLARGSTESTLRQRLGRLVVLGLWTLVAMAPAFYWKWYAFGHPLMHPSQYPHFQGFRPEFTHQFLGIEFHFNGLFNWPLHDQLIRTPHFGYPTYLLFPLVTLRSLGAAACALILLGLVCIKRTKPILGLFLVAWMVPVYLLFGPQENWEEVKMTFMLLAWPPLVPLFAVGLDHLLANRKDLRFLVGAAAAVVVLMTLGQTLGRVEVPEDPRWYVRFPKAASDHPGAQAGLSESERNDWIYFQSFETEQEIERERRKLRSVWPWPATYLPLELNPGETWAKIGHENGQRDLEVLEIWGYIYGSRH